MSIVKERNELVVVVENRVGRNAADTLGTVAAVAPGPLGVLLLAAAHEDPVVLFDGAVDAAGLGPFAPDACLINRYAPGTSLGAHQDRDEPDTRQPIVSVSIGLPAVFCWYGPKRSGTPIPIRVTDGDVVVFGGPARRGYHGVRRLADGDHPLTGRCRINLTFRRAEA